MNTLRAEKAIKEIAYTHLGSNVFNNLNNTSQGDALVESFANALAEAYIAGYSQSLDSIKNQKGE